MFVQIIEGRTKDAEGQARHGATWDTAVGKPGILGVTAGATDDGRFVSVVRFESEEAARAIQDSPEQTAWFETMSTFYDGPPTFAESSEVEELLGGGPDEAGFVQVMRSTGVDRAQVQRMDKLFETFADQRPDLLGVLRVWTGPDSCVDVAYFSSEAEARAGEQVEMPAELQEAMADMGEPAGTTEYLDLKQPYLR